MTVNTIWVDPTGATLDKATDDVITEAMTDGWSSDLNRLGGSDGNSKTGHYRTIPNALGNQSGAVTADLSLSNVITATLTGNWTSLTLNNPAEGTTYKLILTQDGTGSRTIAWPAAVKWGAMGAPTLSGASKIDMVALYYNGTSYLGSYALNY